MTDTKKGLSKSFKIMTIVITGLILLALFMPVRNGYSGEWTITASVLLGGAGYGSIPYALRLVLRAEWTIVIIQILLYCFVFLVAGVLGLTIASFYTDKVNKALKIVSIVAMVFSLIAFIFIIGSMTLGGVFYFGESDGLGYALQTGAVTTIIWAICSMWLFVLTLKAAERL